MKKLTIKKQIEDLEKDIEVVKNRLDKFNPEDEEYAKILDRYQQLAILYSDLVIKNQSVFSKISPDTMAIVVGNLVGIGLILGYEKTNIITSKALGFVLRGRV